MDMKQRQTLQRFRRLRDFLARNEPAVAYGDVKGQLGALGAVIDRLTTFAVEQDSRTRASKAGTSTANKLLRELRLQYMRPIARMARALFPDDEALLRGLRLPKQRDAQALISAAEAMADTAGPVKELFIKGGFPPDFVERLRNASREVRVAIDARATTMGQRSASTAGTREEVRRGGHSLQLIDAMVRPALESNPPALAEWLTLIRRGRGWAGTTPDVNAGTIPGVQEVKAA